MNFKKFLLAAALACAPAASFAVTYTVVPNVGGENQIPVDFNYWWNFGIEDVKDGDTYLYTKCWAADKGSNAASAGWITYDNQVFDFAKIADHDLVFDAKVEGQGQWNVRLTAADGVESDVTLSLVPGADFSNVRINVAKEYPAVAAKWANGGANGKAVFTFALSGSNLSDDAVIYFKNVRYEDAIAMPVITAEAKDITYNSATLAYTCTFPEGYTNTSVTVNGEAATGNTLALTGLTPNTKYSYVIVATGDFEGNTYSTQQVVDFKTLREPGKNPVWYGLTDIPGFTAEYSITYNDNKTLTVGALFETEKDTPAADRNFHIFIGGDEWLKMKDDGSGYHEGTTTSTFEEGSTITWEWYLPREGGVYQEVNQYVVGSENEAPLSVRVKAEAQNVTFNSAEIAYTVTCPDNNYKVYYKAAEGEAVEATENPIKLAGLTEMTDYTYEVYAVAGEGENAIESKHATVTFKTPSENARDLVYGDLFACEFKNAFLPGEEESMRRSFFVTLPWSVVYRADGTAVYTVDLSQVESLVGLVPQIYWNGFQQLTKGDNGIYTYEFGAQEMDAVTAISHYFAFSGGVVDSRTPYTNWGMEKEAPVLGEATNISLSLSKEACLVNDNVLISVTARDANNYYVPVADIEISSDVAADEIAGSTLTVKNTKGVRNIIAKSGNYEATARLNVIASPEAKNAAAGLKGFTDSYIQAGTVENVTDTDRNSQLEWACGETEEHYFILALEEPKYVEAVEVYFEGAYATEFTVTLSAGVPSEINQSAIVPLALLAEQSKDVTFANSTNGTQHYFTQDPTEPHQYIALRTSKALNTGWGIKLRDMKVYATDEKPTTTGVEAIAVDNNNENAPVIYYNLNGVRVNNPANGLYIRRQGNTVTKVLIK